MQNKKTACGTDVYPASQRFPVEVIMHLILVFLLNARMKQW